MRAIGQFLGFAVVVVLFFAWFAGVRFVDTVVSRFVAGIFGDRRTEEPRASAARHVPHVMPPTRADVVSRVSASVVTVVVADAAGEPFAFGSGFLIAPRAVVTNLHVVAGARRAAVCFADDTTVRVIGVLAVDEGSDLAVLQTAEAALGHNAVPVANASPRPGDAIFVVGSPEGLALTVSSGNVAALRDDERYGPMLQITAAISHGSSGGPVFNDAGEVVGVARMSLREGQSLNFAVPVERIKALWGLGRFPLGPQDFPPGEFAPTPRTLDRAGKRNDVSEEQHTGKHTGSR